MEGSREAKKWERDCGNAGSYLINPLKYLLEPEAGKHYDIWDLEDAAVDLGLLDK